MALVLMCSTFCLASLASPLIAPIQPTILHQFNNTVQPENLIVRPNGQILVTDFSGPQIFQIDPASGRTREVFSFPYQNKTSGIVELSPDLYAVAAGNYSQNSPSQGTWNIWTMDLTAYHPAIGQNNVTVQLLDVVFPAILVDGLTVINAKNRILAGGDPYQGVIYNIDLYQGTVDTLVRDPSLMGYPLSNNTYTQLGVNGLKYQNGKVYFTNTGKNTLGYVAVDPNTGKINDTQNTHQVFNYTIHLDDFYFAKSGNTYLTTVDTPNGGILRRMAGTSAGVNGTQKVISKTGANAVILTDIGGNCILFFNDASSNQVLKAQLPGAC